jgi:hypothetical protein
VSVGERSCPTCGASVLVDLVVTSAMHDGRERYRLARALAPLGEGRVTVAAVQSALAGGRGRVLSGVPRRAAEEGADLVRAAGVAARIQGAGSYRPAASEEPGRRWWLFPAVLTVLAVVGATAWIRLRPPAKEATTPHGTSSLPVLTPTEVAARGVQATVALRCGEQLGSGFFVDR